MSENRVIEYVDLDDLLGADEFFKRHSGIDVGSVSEKYGDTVAEARRLLRENCRVALVYERVGIRSVGEETVELATGHTLSGKMVCRVLSQSKETYLFVASLEGGSRCTSDDIMVEYFTDTWASAYVEAAQMMFADKVAEKLEEEGLKRTHVWCPGQTQFDLVNQRPLFDMLHPEDVGCTLTSRLMMVPVKSASGIIGVVSSDAEVSLVPCDFCSFSKSCPSSKQGCAVL